MRSLRCGRSVTLLLLFWLGTVLGASQQGPVPVERLTFDQAIQRAIENNPTVAQAAAGIVQAEAILQQVRAASRPGLDANVTTSVIDPVPSFGGNSINPRTQVVTSAGFVAPLISPVEWARRNQAGDQVVVAQRSLGEVRRQIAIAAAQAYLRIVASRRQLDLAERARETASAHHEFARQLFEGGLGSRLNQLRAEQAVSTDETRVEATRLAIALAQEALGVLVAADGPVDAAEEPAFEVPPPGDAGDTLTARTDIQLLAARQSASERVVRDSWKDYLPSVTGLFTPQVLTPSGLFQPARNLRAQVVFHVELFDSGARKGLARERQSLLDMVRAERAQLEREVRSEVRAARETVASTERALESARRAAGQAAEVVRITDAAFRAGATTNIEVLDAQREARDTETAAAIAEDAVRRARLDLLVALGRFPR